MKAKLLNVAVLVTFTMFIIMVMYKLNVIEKKYSELKVSSISQTDSIKQILAVIENVNLIESIEVQDCFLQSNLTNKSINLSTLLTKASGNSIIYRLIETSCGSCNERQIELLGELQSTKNLIVLSNSSSARYLHIFANEAKIHSTIYQYNTSHKLFDEDDNSKVLVMYVSNEGTILRAYLLNEENLFLVKNIVPF